MKRNVLFLLIVIIVLNGVICYASISNTEPEKMAQSLYDLGLLRGVGTTPNGSVDFNLEGNATRTEGIVMLIRILGEEKQALNYEWSHPFEDVPEWANRYIGYAYEKGLTNGVSDNLFGSDIVMSDNMYITFVLRSGGYSDNNSEDFQWESPYEFAQKLGITHAKETQIFKRKDMIIISTESLKIKMKNTDKTIADDLIGKNVFSEELYNRVMENNVQEEKVCEHKVVVDERVEATCVNFGMTEGIHCMLCDKVFQEQKRINKISHSYGKWCKANDELEYRECTFCGKSEERVIEKEEPTSISIVDSVKIDKNEVYTIRPEFSPIGTYSDMEWTSSNESVVRVVRAGIGTSANITGISAGKANIVVKTQNGLTAYCEVEVIDIPTSASITVPDLIEVKRGYTKDIEISVEPSNSKSLYRAESSDSDIVSVNTTGGRTGVRLKGVNEGYAEITIMTDDGLTAVCGVNVIDSVEPVSIEIPDSYSMNRGEKWEVPIKISPSGAGTGYEIFSSDSDVVKVATTGGKTGCRVTAYSKGVATITIYTDNGLFAECEITVN